MPDARVGHAQEPERALAFDAHVDAAARRGVLDGVVDQDQQHLLDSIRVGLDRGIHVRANGGELDLG